MFPNLFQEPSSETNQPRTVPQALSSRSPPPTWLTTQKAHWSGAKPHEGR